MNHFVAKKKYLQWKSMELHPLLKCTSVQCRVFHVVSRTLMSNPANCLLNTDIILPAKLSRLIGCLCLQSKSWNWGFWDVCRLCPLRKKVCMHSASELQASSAYWWHKDGLCMSYAIQIYRSDIWLLQCSFRYLWYCNEICTSDFNALKVLWSIPVHRVPIQAVQQEWYQLQIMQWPSV